MPSVEIVLTKAIELNEVVDIVAPNLKMTDFSIGAAKATVDGEDKPLVGFGYDMTHEMLSVINYDHLAWPMNAKLVVNCDEGDVASRKPEAFIPTDSTSDKDLTGPYGHGPLGHHGQQGPQGSEAYRAAQGHAATESRATPPVKPAAPAPEAPRRSN